MMCMKKKSAGCVSLQGELDRERFSADLKRAVETDTGYKAELRVFVSKGEIFSICFCQV